MSPILKVDDLKKTFRVGFLGRKQEVLKGVSFSVKKGSVTGFLGRNGAGKTTTMKCLLGLIFADSGQIEFFGEKEFAIDLKARIGFLPERPYFYDYLTGDEFLRFYQGLSNRVGKTISEKRFDELFNLVDLEHARHRPLRGYSKGMLQRIGLAQALIHEPELIILDEPMSGLDPDGRFRMNQIIRQTAEQGTTVFFSSHLLHDAETLCDDLIIMHGGKVIYQGELEQFLGKMSSGYRLVYSQGGSKKIEKLTDEKQLQEKLDEVRKLKGLILEVKAERPSLEEGFVQISSGEQR